MNILPTGLSRKPLIICAKLYLLILVCVYSNVYAAAPKKHKTAAQLKEVILETYAEREEVVDFAQELAARAGLDAAAVIEALSQARKLPQVQKLLMPAPAGTKKNWRAYRSRFIDAVRIKAGVQFWQDNEEALARAQAQFGVSQEVIIGIIGVETIYGRNMGSFRAVDALATLAFDFPQGRSDRSPYFKEQLGFLFTWAARENIDPLSVLSSYAGAIGIGQFMPESILKHGVDFDESGKIDLRASATDAIGSVAKYLADYGWVPNLPSALRVNVDRADLQTLLVPDITPTFDAATLKDKGVELIEPLPENENFALIELQNADDRSDYALGTLNFYVITRYNRSSYYAMSVVDLGREVARERQRLFPPVEKKASE
jgi:membrane-bound lytic murein transglycosylase B